VSTACPGEALLLVPVRAVLRAVLGQQELEGLHSKPLRVAAVMRTKTTCSRHQGSSSRAGTSCAKVRKAPCCRDRDSTSWFILGSLGQSSGGSSGS